MFVDYNYLLTSVLIAASLLGCESQAGRDANGSPPSTSKQASAPEVGSSCDATGNCMARLSDVPHATEICDGMSPTLYWNNNKPNLLLACECNCSSHDNMGWLVFADRTKIKGVHLGKSTTPESLRGVKSIPDIMASHPLCTPVDPDKLVHSDFVSLVKYPTNDGASPYCFEARFILESGGEVQISEGGEVLGAADEDVFMETDTKTTAEVLKLVEMVPAR